MTMGSHIAYWLTAWLWAIPDASQSATPATGALAPQVSAARSIAASTDLNRPEPDSAAALRSATERELRALPVLTLPDIDPDQWLLDGSYRFGGGTGEDPTLTGGPLVPFVANQPYSVNPVINPNLPFPRQSHAALRCGAAPDCDAYCKERGYGPSTDPMGYAGCAAAWWQENLGGRTWVRHDGFGWHIQTPVFAHAELSYTSERGLNAYGAALQGYGTGLFTNNGGVAALSGRLSLPVLRAFYKQYVEPTPHPPFALVMVDANGSIVMGSRVAGVGGLGTLAVPLHATVALGYGRLLNIEPRLRWYKLEYLLRSAGVMTASVPDTVISEIMRTWWALRNEVGYDQRLLYTLRVLLDAGLLEGGLDQATVYRFGRIFADSQMVDRKQGQETYAGLRLGHLLQAGMLTGSAVPSDLTLVVEARRRQVFNLNYDSDLTLAVAVGIAPRPQDQVDNTLPGEALVFPGVMQGRVVVNMPIEYTWFLYDDYQNRRGAWNIHCGFGLGVGVPQWAVAGAPAWTNLAVAAGFDYTFLRQRRTALRLGWNADVGFVYGTWLYALTAYLRIDVGTAEAAYVGPVPVRDAAPFALPLPLTVPL